MRREHEESPDVFHHVGWILLTLDISRFCCILLDYSSCQLDVGEVISVICHILEGGNFGTKVAALQWLGHMLTKVPKRTFQNVDTFFPVLLQTLSDESEEVLITYY